jgi:hypothetical protein
MKMYKIFNNPNFIYLFITIFINSLFVGCYTIQEVDLEKEEVIKIYKIETKEGEVIDLRETKLGFGYLYEDEIIVLQKDGKQVKYPLMEVKKIYTEKMDTLSTTFLAIVGGGVFIFSIIGLMIGLSFSGVGG